MPDLGFDINATKTELKINMTKLEIVCKMKFFKDFSQEEIALITEVCGEEEYAKGSIIFKEDTPADKFYLIVDGQIKISHRLEKLGEEELVVLDEGECFGEMSLIDGGPRSASAVAELDTKLLAINLSDIRKIFEKNNDIAIKVLTNFCHILSARLRDANKQISDMTGLFLSFRTKNNVLGRT